MKEHTILLEKVQADITGCLRFAETKNGALLAFDIALLFGIPKIPDVSVKVKYIVTAMIIYSLIITLWSFWPINKKIKKAEKRKVNCDLLHFAYIAMYTRNEYLVELYKSYWKNEVVDFDKISQEEKDLAQATELINESEKPFVFVGGGAVTSGASKELMEFVKKIEAPVADSLMGKGAFDGTDELYMGMLGMHGTKASNLGVTKCDLLITVGSRFSDRVIGNASRFAKNAKILQIDVDPAEINKNIQVDCSIIGDLKEVLTRLNQRIEKHEHKEWIKEIETISEEHPLKYNEEGLTGPYVIEQIYKVTEGNAIITTDVGQHQMWAAQYYRYKDPRTFLSSGGLGTMGYGVGAAIGAKVGRPDKVVLNIAGDGCFRMNMNEIATAARYNIPIIQVVINNHVLGMVRQWQTLFYGKRYSQTILNDGVDFVKVAEALGAEGIRVTKKEEVAPAVEKAIALGKPVVIDCVIDCDDKVFPMVPAGAPIEDVFDQDDLNKEA